MDDNKKKILQSVLARLSNVAETAYNTYPSASIRSITTTTKATPYLPMSPNLAPKKETMGTRIIDKIATKSVDTVKGIWNDISPQGQVVKTKQGYEIPAVFSKKGAEKTAKMAYGVARAWVLAHGSTLLTPMFVGASGLLGGALNAAANKIYGGSAKEGFEEGFSSGVVSSPAIASTAKITDALFNPAINMLRVRLNPAISNQITGRIGAIPREIAQGMAFNAAAGRPYTPTDVGYDVGTAALFGTQDTPQFRAKLDNGDIQVGAAKQLNYTPLKVKIKGKWQPLTQSTKGVDTTDPRNFKSAEEFVKAQELPQILRGTKGMTAEDIMKTHPNIKLTKDVPATDIYGNKVKIPEGEKLTPYELKGNKILLQDGETYIVSKNQFQNIKGNAVGGEAKPFAPELEGLEETVKTTERFLTEKDLKQVLREKDNFGTERYVVEFKTGQKYIAQPHETRQTALANAYNANIRAKGMNTKFSQYQLPNGKDYFEVIHKDPKFPVKPDESHFGDAASWHRGNYRTYKGKKVYFVEEFQKGKHLDETVGHPLAKGKYIKAEIQDGLKKAVDNKSDYFAWTTGEQQSARYNLAKDLEYTKWRVAKTYSRGKEVGTSGKVIELKPKESSHIIDVGIDDNGKITDLPSKPEYVGKRLDEFLGKGLADKIMAQETGTLAGEGLKFGGEWANNLYDKQVPNIVKKLTGENPIYMDMGLPIDSKNTVKFTIQSGRDAGGKLLKSDIKVGLEVETGGKDYIITDILGDGKFKAVPKGRYDTIQKLLKENEFPRHYDNSLYPTRTSAEKSLEFSKQTFDISQKTTQQIGIKLTPEVKAKIQGKAPDIKTSGKMFEDPKSQLTDIWNKSQLEPKIEGKPSLIDRKVDLGVNQQKEIVPELEKVQQPQIEISKPTTQVEQGSVPAGKVKLKTDQTVSKNPSITSISKKGKLNTDKLNITPEQKVAIDEIQDNVPVTVISNKEVVDASRTTTGRKTVLTDEMQKKILAQQLNSRQEVVSLQKQYDQLRKSGADELELIALKEKIINQSRVSQQERTFAGRLLQSGNIMANDLATPEQKIYALLDNAGVDSKKYVKEAINVDFNNPTQVVEFYRKFVPPKFSEVLDEIRYSNMLSSPLTQIVNTASNIIQSIIVKPIEKTITGQLDWIKSKLTGSERQYYASQGIDYAKGVWRSLPDAWTKFKSIASGKEINLRPDMEFIPTTTKGPLKWYTTPLRTLEASDQFFRTLVQGGEKKSLARLKLSDTQIAKRAAESADYTLFRQKFDPDGELGQGGLLKVWDKWNSVMSMARRLPGGKWIVPFLQTPTNILKQGFEYSPLGFSTAIGAKRPLEQLSKAMIGTAVFSATYGLADTGQITWSVPINEKDKELFYAAGMQPYSIKIGDKWVSYQKLGPLSYPMAMAGALKWAERNNPDQNFGEDLLDAMPQMVQFFGDQSYVRSLGDTIDSIKGSNSNMLNTAISKQFSNFAGQLVPWRSFQGWLTRMIDPTYRKPEGVVENLMAQTPGLSQNVPAYTDMYGEESKRDMPFINAVSPAKISTEKPAEKSLYESQEQYRIGLNQKNEMKKEFEKTGKIKTKGTKTTPYFYTDDTGQVKEVKIDKYTSMPEQTAYQRALKEKQKYTLVDDILDNLDGDQQIEALQALGISSEDATYYNTAKQENYLKSIYVREEISKIKDKGELLKTLVGMRKEIGGRMLLSSGVIDDLVDEGYISYDEGKQLKKVEFGKDQKPKVKTTGRGASAKIKNIKFVPLSVKLPKSDTGGSATAFNLERPEIGSVGADLSVPKLKATNIQQPQFKVKFNL